MEIMTRTRFRSIDEARETYEELVATFPTSGRYWKAYIEQVGLALTRGIWLLIMKVPQHSILRYLSIIRVRKNSTL